ncbi:D5 family helicase-primase [Bodo saltans virus]|uniref:D5 family helicase-primase n=1 Tax=Bodo saltans virus TaxID=2024608 RepID=A0A2H4UW70_9VIRU|nr:D5 family helicase-primase [Bodo saltans virus]ATZ81126.1 D5 family helicase-primase [Bodo saltans virus]
MEKIIIEYTKHNITSFSINIGQKYNEKQKKWKKELIMPPRWQKLTVHKYIKEYNGVALLTGETNKIIVVDIDNIEHWNKLLNEYNEKEPKTVKAESGSGGIHLYFKYTDDLGNITSTDHKFGKEYDIDLKTNGGCIIAPPSTYHNKNFDKKVSYKWVNSIFDMEPIELPLWIKKILFGESETKNKKKTDDNDTKDVVEKDKSNSDSDDINELENMDFTEDDIEQLVKMLLKARAEGYSDWLNVGMCLCNLSADYRHIWKEFSKKSKKYDEKENTEKWKSFKRNKNGLKVGSLLKWAKEDNPEAYAQFINDRNLKKMIVAKYPNDKLEIGDVINVNDVCKYVNLHNEDCPIKGGSHGGNPTNYVEITKDCISLKCTHSECFGRTHCNYVNMTKQEMNLVFSGNILNINVKSDNIDNDIGDIDKLNIYDDINLNELVYAGLCDTATQYANILHYLNKDKYVYAENDSWYIYKDKWIKEGKRTDNFRKLIDVQLKQTYLQMISKYIEIEGKNSKTVKYLKRLIDKFGDTSLKNNIITESISIFVNKNFISNLDANYNLLGFNNGVFDLDKFIFREGKPDDFISMTTGYDYVNTYTSKYKELMQFLEDIQPNKEEREYMLTYLSIGLFGNQLELFTILTGCGRNGKSKLIELLEKTFGDYFGSVQSQLFTRPRPDANSPDPGLLSLQKKRVVIASEPEKNSKLNSGFIKFITGRDSTTLRNCHSNDMVKFTARFITLLICNDIPDCDDIDNAFSKRLRCIDFPTEFVDNPSKDNQKKINVNINMNFEFWKFDFMLLLIEHYKKYCEHKNLKTTDNILKWTNQYKENADIYLQFLNECTIKSSNHTSTTDLYEKFKIWYKQNNPQSKIPSNRTFIPGIKRYISIDNVKIDGKNFYGAKNLSIVD